MRAPSQLGLASIGYSLSSYESGGHSETERTVLGNNPWSRAPVQMTKRQLTRFGGFPLPDIKMPAFNLGLFGNPGSFCLSQKRHKYLPFLK